MKLTECLKKGNRTLLEMYLGILFCGVVCQSVGAFIVKDQVFFAVSLWFGIIMALVSTLHMYRSLDRALGAATSAAKLAMYGYMIRYVFLAVILILIMTTEVMNPLVVFMAYMSLKVAALIQPFTHKLCNKIFHEEDPIPTALPEEVEEQSGTADRN